MTVFYKLISYKIPKAITSSIHIYPIDNITFERIMWTSKVICTEESILLRLKFAMLS